MVQDCEIFIQIQENSPPNSQLLSLLTSRRLVKGFVINTCIVRWLAFHMFL